MADALELRDYQTDTIEAIEKAWANGTLRAAAVLPTGAGKTVVFSHLAARQTGSRGRTLVIAHREELLNQAAAKIRTVAPHLNCGIVKAEQDEHDGADIVVASVQTLAVPRRRARIENVGLVIIDEAHHAAAETYRTVMGHFGCFEDTPAAGFTATMARTDGGLAEVWDDVVFRLDILTMISRGFLVDVHGKQVVCDGLDLSGVKSRGGDYVEGQLGQALSESGAADAVAQAYREFAADRAGVVFTPTVDTAKQMAEVLNAAGFTTAPVWGDMGSDERRRVLAAYERGDIQILTNCMVLTEGFDAPWASCCVVARPTRSTPLYVQMVGRVLRTFPGKKDALVLDVVGVTGRHKLASIVDLTEARVRNPSDGESLGEAAEKSGVVINGNRIRVSGWNDVELFEESPVSWQRTPGGTWFVAAGKAEYFLIPGSEPDSYRIRRIGEDGVSGPPDGDRDLSLTFAMQAATKHAQHEARAIANRAAPWRKRPATTSQLMTAQRMKLAVPENPTQGAVSDLIAGVVAARHIDPFVSRLGGVR